MSQYPALSHTFVLHEVLALRRNGVDVRVVSVRECDRPMAALSVYEAEEAKRTFSVIGAGPQDQIAQNGIQISGGATAKIKNTTVTGNECNHACVVLTR